MSQHKPICIDIQLPLSPFTLRFSETLTAQVTGLFGPSGSGKSSLLETLAGLNPNATGRIRFGDTVWQDSERGVFMPPEDRRIGLVPQAGLLFPHRTVRHNILFGAKRSGLDSTVFDRLVDILQLSPLLDRKPYSLSGGERQRVAAARAVCSGPQLLLMDEPLSAVDQRLRYATLNLLTQLSETFQIPMVWVSHDAIELQAVCDELVALDSGHVVTRGTPREVLTNASISPAVQNSGFSNLFRCQIVSSNEDETVVQLAGTDPKVNLCVAGSAAGQQADDAWLTIPARSILIATEDPTHVSARNTLHGTVVSCKKQTKGIVMLEISLDDRGSAAPMIVEVTQAACDKLSLTPNRTVYVLIKSTACVLNATR